MGQIGPRQADCLPADVAAGLVQKAEYDFLPEHRRERGHAQVDGLVFRLHVEASVLRNAAFGDVHGAHDFDTGNHGALDVLRDGQNLLHDAVDTHTDVEAAFARLDVDVTGALLNGALNHGVYEPDGGGAVDGVVAHAAAD